MIRVLIFDNEPSYANAVALAVQKIVHNAIIQNQTSYSSHAVEQINSFKPHLVFLDVKLAEFNSFEFLQKLKDIDFETVFTAFNDQFAIQAIRFNALDYLLKPFDTSDLYASLNRFVLKCKRNEKLQQPIINSSKDGHALGEDFKLTLSTTEGIHLLKPNDIMRLEADGSYTKFHLVNKVSLVISRTLREFEESLSLHGFIRTHKSHLVNARFIQSISAANVFLQNGESVEVARRRRSEVKSFLFCPILR
jgi:two-component system LytT family response regulator